MHLEFSSDGRYLAELVGGEVLLWRIPTADLATHVRSRDDATVSDAAISPDGKLLVTGFQYDLLGDRKTIRLLDTSTGQASAVFHLDSSLAGERSIIFTQDGKSIAFACVDSIELWNVVDRNRSQIIPIKGWFPERISIDSTGSFLAEKSSHIVVLRQLSDGGFLRLIESEFYVEDAIFSPTGKMLAIAISAWNGRESKIRIWSP